jgi:uncharacterized protein GlcG (DUF336 family)
MSNTTLMTGVATVILLGAGLAQAQQAAPNPLDVIPDKMPFDVPYGPPIGVDRARSLIAATADEAKKHGWKLNIAVVDAGGNLVAFERMDGAQLASIAISEHKARTAALYRRETKAFESGVQAGLVYQLSLDGIIASRGGIPLVENGVMIGALGCSGGTGSQDEASCKAGAALVNK